jgi:hypothetical protein
MQIIGGGDVGLDEAVAALGDPGRLVGCRPLPPLFRFMPKNVLYSA